jgi:hypothetical protein
MGENSFGSTFSAAPGPAEVWGMYNSENRCSAANAIRAMNRGETVALLRWALRNQPAEAVVRFHDWVGNLV